MSNLLNGFTDAWKDYGVKHGIDSDKKCVEHAIRASIVVDVEKKTSVFDWKRYITNNSDLTYLSTPGVYFDANEAISHYLNYGKNESRQKYILGTNEPYVYDFDWKLYSKLNPDVFSQRGHGDAVCELHCFRHWCEYGYKEGRQTGIEKKPSVFDWKRYVNEHVDLKRVLTKHNAVTVNDATGHYLNYGMREKRKVFILGTNEPYVYDFDWKLYDKLNPDVFIQRERGELVGQWHCFRHWCEIGHKAGRPTGNNKLLIKKGASISTKETVNKRWKRQLTNLIQPEYKTVDDLINSVNQQIIDATSAMIDATFDSTFDSTVDNIDNQTLTNIYKNIDDFSKFIKPYKNILFICSDYPGYGGAATNCDNLSKYYAKTHNVKSIYWTYSHYENIKSNISNLYTIVSSSKIQSTLKTLTFKPDIIILKNSIACDLTKIFTCPIIFLVPGIYKNELNVHYTMLDTIEKQHKFINQSTLTQIRNSTYCFCNSSHTQDILKKWYDLKTSLFCSTFIQFYGQTIQDDPNFHNRKYDYGFIISDFTRKIKNVDKSINFLKDKQNVILIGSGSSKYKSYGFECIELVDNDKMANYYKQIKNIVHDGFYESCSNVMVEWLFSGRDIYINLPNSNNSLISNLINENKDALVYDFIIYKNIQYNINYLNNININNIKFVLIDEETYFNIQTDAIPIFNKNILIENYSKEIIHVYSELFTYNVDELNKYIKYLIYELDRINIKNIANKQCYITFLKKFNSIKQKKIKNGILIISFGEGYNNILEYVVSSYRKYSKLPILIYTDDTKIDQYFKEDTLIFPIYIKPIFIDDILFSRIIKTQCYKYSPFEHTMYVDVDSLCCNKFDYLFDYLENHDLCMQPSNVLNIPFNKINTLLHSTCIDRYIEQNNIHKTFEPSDLVSIYAGGLVLFKKSAVMKRIFVSLPKYWYEGGAIFDMPAWMIVLYKEKQNYKMFNLDAKYFNSPNSSVIKSLHYIPPYMSKIGFDKFIKYKYHETSKQFELCDVNNKFIKKTIIIMYDVDGWVLNTIASIVKKYLSKYYIIEIKNEGQGPKLKNDSADLFFTFNLMNYSIGHIDKSKIICGRTSLVRTPDPTEYKKFKVLHANNNTMINILKKISSNVFYIPNGIELSNFYNYTRINTDKQKIKLGMICSTQRKSHKGYEYYLNVIKQLTDMDINVENNSIISDPYDKTTIINNDTLISHYNNNIDIYICVSESETGPQPCLEALACGKIVISTSVGLMPDIITNDKNGYIVENRSNTENIVKIILNYLNKTDDEKQIMSQNAIKSVEKHSWELMAINYKNMFDFYFTLP